MKTIKKNIGKNTLGDNNKMQVDLRTYNRSTHNLSYAWRNTQGVGTLVPCMKILTLPGDTFDIEIDSKVLTHPTVGPLFGSYKLQVDLFTCPIRLYNAMLHNNALNIGLDMSKVKLPQLQISSTYKVQPTVDNPFSQIHPSSVLAYLGLRGWASNSYESGITNRNAVPILAYLDIFKNYYANKQEENFYWLGADAINFTESNDLEFQQSNGGRIAIGSITIITSADYNKLAFKFRKNRNETVIYSAQEMKRFGTTSTSASGITFNIGGGEFEPLYAIRYDGAIPNPEVTIQNGLLEDLDTLREQILSAGNEVYNININSEIEYFHQMLDSSTNGGPVLASPNQGLLLKTFQSDLFTNWINTEWIDGDNGISAITAIDTSSGEFTIDTLNLAKKVYDMLNRIAVSGGSYRDWIETVYTSDYVIHAETPIYEGGMSDEIVFQEVVSNSATEDEPLGTLAGRGTLGGMRKGGKLHIKIQEPSYLIGICSITPRVDYCQGNDFDMYLTTMNDLHKPQLDGIGYEDLTLNNCVWWKSTKMAYGKTVAWIHYMTNFNKTYGNFAIEGNEAFMCLNRFFTPEDESDSGYPTSNINTTSYINPADFNYVFADNNLEAQNFWVQLGFKIAARRVMSAKQIPNL